MAADSQASDKKLQQLIALRNRVMEDIEKSRTLLTEIEEAIAGNNPVVLHSQGTAKKTASADDLYSATTGIPRLDELLGGGFGKASNILLIGPPYSSKFTVADSFIAASLRSGYPVIVVSLDRDIRDLRNDLSGLCGPLEHYEQNGLLKFVDAYSRSIQMETEGTSATIIDNAGNVSNFLRTMDTICESVRDRFGQYRMVLFSLTGWITQVSDEKNFTKAFQHFSQRRKLEGATTLFLIEDGIFQGSLYENMNYFMDGAVEFRNEVSTEYLRIRGLKNVRSRDWVEIVHSGNGLSLGSFELKRIK